VGVEQGNRQALFDTQTEGMKGSRRERGGRPGGALSGGSLNLDGSVLLSGHLGPTPGPQTVPPRRPPGRPVLGPLGPCPRRRSQAWFRIESLHPAALEAGSDSRIRGSHPPKAAKGDSRAPRSTNSPGRSVTRPHRSTIREDRRAWPCGRADCRAARRWRWGPTLGG